MDMRNIIRNGLLALAVAATVTSGAVAQRPYNRGYSHGHNQEDGRNVAGQFDYYALVLSWSPSYCAGVQREGYDPQCDRTDGKRYNFVLHGLWPQYAPKGWPQDCPVSGRAFVPRGIINAMLDIMPSDKLVIHEYRKHGTCSGLEPPQYFDLARKLFKSVTVPDDYRNPAEAKYVSPADLVTDFQKVNPWLKADMIAVDCGRSDRLSEIRICFSKAGEPQTCSRNEDQRKMCRAEKIYLPPVRASRTEAPERETNAPPPPRPQILPNAHNI